MVEEVGLEAQHFAIKNALNDLNVLNDPNDLNELNELKELKGAVKVLLTLTARQPVMMRYAEIPIQNIAGE